MKLYKLDIINSKIIQLSNDAFFYMKEDEEMLDESNMEEVEEISALFPCGFEIKDDWKEIEDGYIEATFIPYIETRKFNYRIGITNAHIFEFSYIDNKHVIGQFTNILTNSYFNYGEWPISYINGKQWAVIKNESCNMPTSIPLWKNVIQNVVS